MHYLLFVHNGIVSQYQKNYLDRCNFLHIQIIFHTIKAEQMTRWLSPIKEKRHNHCVQRESIPHVLTQSHVCHNLRQFSLHLTHGLALRQHQRKRERTRAGCLDLDKNTTETTDPLRIKTLFRQEGLVFERSCTAASY